MSQLSQLSCESYQAALVTGAAAISGHVLNHCVGFRRVGVPGSVILLPKETLGEWNEQTVSRGVGL